MDDGSDDGLDNGRCGAGDDDFGFGALDGRFTTDFADISRLLRLTKRGFFFVFRRTVFVGTTRLEMIFLVTVVVAVLVTILAAVLATALAVFLVVAPFFASLFAIVPTLLTMMQHCILLFFNLSLTELDELVG